MQTTSVAAAAFIPGSVSHLLLCGGPKMHQTPLSLLLLMLTLCMSLVIKALAGDGKIPTAVECEFPEDWRGRYFQSSLGMLTVSRKGITTKGICIERNRDYFLFHNRESNCYQCLLLLRQHKNIIQYKESYCTSSASALKMVCTEIRVETPLYTLVREPAIPVACPFVEASYRFDFSDLIHGFCGRPASSAHRCSLSFRFQMHFSDCIKATRFQGKEIELECLATWKDGSETYLYGRLTGSSLLSKDDRYRCFKYQMYGSDVFMSMTADATCRGLRSSSDGPFLLEFYKDESVISQLNCRFPDWLSDITWRSIGGHFRYRLEENGAAIYRSEEHGPKDRSFGFYRCHSTQRSTDPKSEKLFFSSVSIKNCSSFVQCLMMERIGPGVIRFSEGNIVERRSDVNCESKKYETTEILIPSDQVSVACPNPGVHHTTPSGGCIHRLNIGCHDERTIIIDHSCSPGQPGLVFECYASWSENNVVFVILKKPDSVQLECFTFRQEGGLTIFSSDMECDRNLLLPHTRPPSTLSYSILRRESCKRNTKTTDVPFKLTTEDTTTKPTTNFVNYYHLEESLYEDSSFNYDDFESRSSLENQVVQQRQLSESAAEEYDDNDDENDDEDDDDDDDDDGGGGVSSTVFSGAGIAGEDEEGGGVRVGGVGGRREVFEWYDEPFRPTQRTDEPKYRRTTAGHSDSKITGNSFQRQTDSMATGLKKINLNLSNDNNKFEAKEMLHERDAKQSPSDYAKGIITSSSSSCCSCCIFKANSISSLLLSLSLAVFIYVQHQVLALEMKVKR